LQIIAVAKSDLHQRLSVFQRLSRKDRRNWQLCRLWNDQQSDPNDHGSVRPKCSAADLIDKNQKINLFNAAITTFSRFMSWYHAGF
jgi:hypothetical protein